MTMNALRLTDNGPLLDGECPEPTPGAGEALIAVRMAGICSTDFALIKGYQGGFRGVLGHEFVGEVLSAPDAPHWVGRRVVGEINIGCGECPLCDRGLGKHCRQRKTLGIHFKDGVMAEKVTLPIANLHEVPAGVSDEQAVFVEPLAAALEIVEQIHFSPTTRAYLIGAGRLGMLIAQVLALTGCDLTVVGRHQDQLQLLEEWTGCKSILAVAGSEPPLPNDDADVVVEATGSPDGFLTARRVVRPGGTIVLKSTFAEDSPTLDLSRLVVDEVTMVGSRCGPFAPALRLLESGKVQVLPLVHATYDLIDAVAALQHAKSRGVLKVLLRP